jgi:hypothetical protein
MIEPNEGLPLENLHIAPTGDCQAVVAIWPRSIGAIAEGFSLLADVTRNGSWADVAKRTLVAGTLSSRFVRDDGVTVHGSGIPVIFLNARASLLIYHVRGWRRCNN